MAYRPVLDVTRGVRHSQEGWSVKRVKRVMKWAKVGFIGPLKFQSAYRKGHSTETALLRVQSDILYAIDQGKAAYLILLDLSAAFDTIDQEKLLEYMKTHLGIGGTVLNWFRSYLCNRKQSVVIDGVSSQQTILQYGVPQGSVLGPILFCIYKLPHKSNNQSPQHVAAYLCR